MTQAFTSDTSYSLHSGDVPILISIPHLGTDIPDDLQDGYSSVAKQRADTDWHLDRLYGFAAAMGIGVIQAKISRYVIDLNRPSSGESLYPGQNTTGLCPTHTFRNEPLYKLGCEPNAEEIQKRVQRYWKPYHDALANELKRLQVLHGQVLLWEAHSIASVLPHLFEGKLPDFNFGSNVGASCSGALTDTVVQVAGQYPEISMVVNGRFKGGYITRHYGAPSTGVHAIQLEMCQSLYMDETWPFAYSDAKAAAVRVVLQRMLQAAHTAIKQYRI